VEKQLNFSRNEKHLPPFRQKEKYPSVQKRDPLRDISGRHGGIPVRMLRKWNKLPSGKFKPGQKLIVGRQVPR
jgi:hypothetical protein